MELLTAKCILDDYISKINDDELLQSWKTVLQELENNEKEINRLLQTINDI